MFTCITRAQPTIALYARRKCSPPNKENQNIQKQIFEKGAQLCKERTNKNSILQAQLGTMGDNSSRFQDHPLKTVGAVFTRICYLCISKF